MEPRDLEHYLREIEQVRLVQSKLIGRLEEEGEAERKNTIDEAVANLDSLVGIATRLKEVLSAGGAGSEELGKLAGKLQEPLGPVRECSRMLLEEKFGRISDEQREKIKSVERLIGELARIAGTVQADARPEDAGHDDGLGEGAGHRIRELEQEKMILGGIVRDEERRYRGLSRKHALVMAGAVAAVGILLAAYSVLFVDLAGHEYRVTSATPTNDGYVVQDLQGQTINTWLFWRLVSGTVIHVNVVDAGAFPGKLDLIKQVITSQKSVKIDDSLLGVGPQGETSRYYMGWEGALLDASDGHTMFYIPTKFDIVSLPGGAGDITVYLTSVRSGDGYSGYTRTIADPSQHQVLKSEITIYQADKLTDYEFEAVFRHEFGHALGLAHSTDPQDLMHATIQTEYPYISQCDINAIRELYNGSEKSQVDCQGGA